MSVLSEMSEDEIQKTDKCFHCGDELEEQNIYNRNIKVEDRFKQIKSEYKFCSFNCMLNYFQKDLKEITDILVEQECGRLLTSGQFISVKEVQKALEELRVYCQKKEREHISQELNGLALDDELTLKGLQMLEARLLEKGLLPQSQEKIET